MRKSSDVSGYSDANDEAISHECFIPLIKKGSILRSTFMLRPKSAARLMVFIKPFDENVFETFYVFVKFIEDLEKELGINIEIIT
jgi:hypothetical protein